MSACPSCGSENQDGVTTCAKCGAGLDAQAMQFGIVCPGCDTYNGPGVSDCVSCGQALAPAGFTGFFQAANFERTNPEAAAPAPDPTAPVPAAILEPDDASQLCSVCKTPSVGSAKFCGGCGSPLRAGSGTMMMPVFKVPGEAAPAASSGSQFFGEMAPGRAKLILIRGEGFEGAEFRLNKDEVQAGRSTGMVLFPSDPFMAPLHATFVYRDGRLHVRDEGTTTGTYVRLRGSTELSPGGEFVVGEHRMRYHGAIPAAGGPAPDGSLIQGAPRPDGAVVVEDILTGGRPGRVWHLGPGTVTFGRQGCEVNLGADRFVSTRHCQLEIQGGRSHLSDLQSVNGTFVRLPAKSERALTHGDYLLMGSQVLRVEIADAA